MSEIDEQPERESRCPVCGGTPTDESARRHHLNAMGYLHDDQHFECAECGHDYSHGVPVGDFDRHDQVDDLWCDVCDLGYMTVHRTEHQAEGGTRLHLKCDHHHEFECVGCGEEIPADGLQYTKTGGRLCPWCEHHHPRDAVPYCFFFRFTHRATDAAGRSLIGYPTTTGQITGAEGPYGYRLDGEGSVVIRTGETIDAPEEA